MEIFPPPTDEPRLLRTDDPPLFDRPARELICVTQPEVSLVDPALSPGMSKPQNFGDLAFTPAVKAMQERRGTRRSYARLEGRSVRTEIGADEAEFIAERDSFYIATVGENGWPYVQYRGGPKGFLRMLDGGTLGFADFRGNGQYVSTGNVLSTHHACLFLMDYPNRTRLKIWAEAEISDDAATIARVTDPTYNAQIERAFLFRVQAFDWNCQKYIVQRFTHEEFDALAALSSDPRSTT